MGFSKDAIFSTVSTATVENSTIIPNADITVYHIFIKKKGKMTKEKKKIAINRIFHIFCWKGGVSERNK